MRRSYTDEERKSVLDTYREDGATVASNEHDVPIRTVFAWASDAGLTAYAEDENKRRTRLGAKREAIRELLLDRTLEMLMRMDGPGKASDMRFMTIAIGTLIDKYRLEAGEVTARTYHEGSDDIDRSVHQLVAELARRGEAPSP